MTDYVQNVGKCNKFVEIVNDVSKYQIENCVHNYRNPLTFEPQTLRISVINYPL